MWWNEDDFGELVVTTEAEGVREGERGDDMAF